MTAETEVREAHVPVWKVLEASDWRIRETVECVSCGWRGPISKADAIKNGPRRVVRSNIYICCPICASELRSLSTDQIKRWI